MSPTWWEYLLGFLALATIAGVLGACLWSKFPPNPPWLRTREDDP